MTPRPDERQERELRVAGRALAGAGLVHAYGHCSVRLDSRHCLVNAPRPLGLLEPGDGGDVIAIDKPLPEGILGEVRMHQAIYRSRPNSLAICRVTPATVTTLSTMGLTPRARHGFGSYFAPAPPLWPGTALVRDDETAEQVAVTLGNSAPAIVLRGNGAIVTAATLPQTVVLAWYLEDAARVELAVRQTPSDIGIELTAEEAATRATWSGGLIDRMWDFLTSGDPEQL
jgi:HCOMODA/2-hydroxy-3-carboxy-muconic semialdehyde decarboxylase